MSDLYFMGIDVGTFESKGVIIDGECRIVASCAQKHELESPQPGYFEHDADKTWWGDVCLTSKRLLSDSGLRGEDISAVGASTLGPDLVPVDSECRPLRKAILYGIDARAAREIDDITAQLGADTVNSLVGHPFNSNDIAPKILWIKNNEPEIYAKTSKFLTGSSFVTAKLTGKYVIDSFLAMGTFMPLYDGEQKPDGKYCGLFCAASQLPEIHASTDIVGHITAEAAEATGLAEGTPVITGTDDAGAEAISVGVLQPGDMMLMFGSSLYIIGLATHDVSDSRIWCDPFIIPGSHSVQGGTNAAGTLTKWYRDNIFFDALKAESDGGENTYEAMYKLASAVPAGSDGLITLPYIAGERTPLNDPLAKGMLFGLTLKHTRAHMYRSALEGVGYSVAQHIDIFSENGVEFGNIVAIGGGSKNPLWMQIVADISGKAIHTAEVNIGASYGDAIMAAIAVGRFSDFGDAAPYIKKGVSYYPNAANHSLYQSRKKMFSELYRRNADLMHMVGSEA